MQALKNDGGDLEDNQDEDDNSSKDEEIELERGPA